MHAAQKFSKGDVIVIGQSGGPTPVINRTLVSLVLSLKERGAEKIYGARFGMKGLLAGEFFNLGAQSHQALQRVANTPGSALGTARFNPKDEDCKRILQVFSKMGTSYFFYIGGDDSAKATLKIYNFLEGEGFPVKAFHLAKTIDNDLRLHYHTPGYGSAALYVANTLLGVRHDLDSDPKVYIVVTMGKDAGYLASASSLISLVGRGPDKIYVPERRFSIDGFVDDVEKAASSSRASIFVVSEGIWTAEKEVNGKIVREPFLSTIGANKKEGDGFGGITLSGTGALADYLADLVQTRLKIKKVRADTLGYPQRSGAISEVDAAEAEAVGREAAIHALQARSGSVALQPFHSRQGMATKLVPLEEVGSGKREMPPEFLSDDGFGISQSFIDYALPLIGGTKALRQTGHLEPKFFRISLEEEGILR